MKNVDNILGKKIQELRNAKGLSQSELAKNAKVARTLITMIESGQRQPTDEALNKILGALGTNKNDFFNDIQAEAKREILNKIESSDAETIIKMYRKVSYDDN